jgi:4-amino-4-deoxy-L-arabinose transferase-like glycosyltransferase
VRAWAVVALLALAPLWLIGMFDRGLWTPDEPREADIVWNMAHQSEHALPRLAGVPFLEKPPLSYWLSAASLRAFGESAWAVARTPNLLYAVVTTLALGALAAAAAGAEAAVIAAVLAGSALLGIRVMVWLAPDAGLLAGCACGLLGAYLGYVAPPGRNKLAGYSLMHIGAAIGFMAKSAPGWLVPALALAALIAWERRWSELRRWELYAGLLLQATIILPWIAAVAATPDGASALRVLFWNNLIGRFTQVAAPTALDYTRGHANSPGKYLIELPVGLLPWTPLVIAALARAWRRARERDAAATAWRFALTASLPFLALLSVAATARDIYAAPVVLGFSLLVGLWWTEIRGAATALDRAALVSVTVLVAAIAVVLMLTLAIFAAAALTPRAQVGLALAALAQIAASVTALVFAGRARRAANARARLGWTFTAYATSLCITCIGAFPVIDRWQNLGALAARIHADTAHEALAVLDADETTIAVLDDRLATRFTVLQTDVNPAARAVASWFAAHGRAARVLVLLPGHAPGEITPLIERVLPAVRPDDGVAGALESQSIARIVARYELPHGRRYALLAPPEV